MSLYKSSSLVMIPTAYKDGKLYSIRPTDGSGDFTFSRGSNLAATRVDVNGLIEKGRENLLLQSNQFDTTWQLTNAPTLTSGQSGYDGTNNAWKLEASTTGSSRSIHQVVSTSGVQVFSVYVKAGTTSWIRLNLSGIGNRYFDIGNGIVGGSGSMDGFITDVGGGWYRCSVLGNGSSTAPYIFLASDNGNLAVNAGDNIYIQDAQLESSLVATSVISTGASTAQAGILEDMPRLDYSGGASCPALLLEPQRTNILAYSEGMFDSSYFLPINGISVEGQQTDLNGTNTAVKLSNFIAGASRLDYNTAVAAVDGKTYTYSAYYKGSGNININVSTSTGVGGAGEKTITLTNEWVRHSITATFSNPTGNVKSHLTITRTANNNAEVYLCFAQIEEGSYPTSYIPTYGSSVTRSYDDCDLLDLVSKDIITDATEWTIMFEVDGFSDEYTIGDGQWFAGQNSTLDVYMHSHNTTDKYGRFYWRKDGKYLSTTNGKKIIARLSNGIGTNFADGVKLASGSITGDYSGIGFNKTNNPVAAGYVKQILVFPTALTDSECIALTTL